MVDDLDVELSLAGDQIDALEEKNCELMEQIDGLNYYIEELKNQMKEIERRSEVSSGSDDVLLRALNKKLNNINVTLEGSEYPLVTRAAEELMKGILDQSVLHIGRRFDDGGIDLTLKCDRLQYRISHDVLMNARIGHLDC